MTAKIDSRATREQSLYDTVRAYSGLTTKMQIIALDAGFARSTTARAFAALTSTKTRAYRYRVIDRLITKGLIRQTEDGYVVSEEVSEVPVTTCPHAPRVTVSLVELRVVGVVTMCVRCGAYFDRAGDEVTSS